MLDPVLLLVLLSVRGDGQPPGVNFVEMPDLPACEARASQLRGILEKNGIQVRHARCVMGIQRFTPHRHQASRGGGKPLPAARRQAYLVALGSERVLAIPKPSLKDCEQARATMRPRRDVSIFCALSDQFPAGARESRRLKHLRQLRSRSTTDTRQAD